MEPLIVVIALGGCGTDPTAPRPHAAELEHTGYENLPFRDVAEVSVQGGVVIVDGGVTVPDSGCAIHPRRADLDTSIAGRLDLTIWSWRESPGVNCPTMILRWEYRTRLLDVPPGTYDISVRHAADGWRFNPMWNWPADTVVFRGTVTLERQ